MSVAVKPLWIVEFRSFAPWDYHTPSLYIAVQRTGVYADDAEGAKAEVLSLATPGGRIEILSVEKGSGWLQPEQNRGAE